MVVEDDESNASGGGTSAAAADRGATPPPGIPLLGMMIDRSSFDETSDFCIDHDALDATDWAKEQRDGLDNFPPPVLMKNGKVRRRLRWRPRNMMKRTRRDGMNSSGDSVSGGASVSSMSISNMSQTSRFSRKSVHSFASTETAVQSNTRKAKNGIFGRGSSGGSKLPRPNYPDSFSKGGISTIGTEGGMIQARMGQQQERKKDVVLEPVNEVASDTEQLEVVLPSKLASADEDGNDTISTADSFSTSQSEPTPETAPSSAPSKLKRVPSSPGRTNSASRAPSTKTPPKSPKKRSGVPPLFQQRRGQVTPERLSVETKSSMEKKSKKAQSSSSPTSSISIPRPDRSYDHEDDAIPLNILTDHADSDRQVDLRILRIPERRDTTNSSSREGQQQLSSSSSSSSSTDAQRSGEQPQDADADPEDNNDEVSTAARRPGRSQRKKKNYRRAGRLYADELRTSPRLPTTTNEERRVESPDLDNSLLDGENNDHASDDCVGGAVQTAPSSPASISSVDSEGVELEGFTDDEGEDQGVDLLTAPSGGLADLFGPLASSSSGNFELRFSMSAPSPDTTSVALAKPAANRNETPPLTVNASDGEASAGNNSCSSSPIPKAHTGPVDVDDGSFLEVEKNLRAILDVATEHLQQGEYTEALEVFEEILRGQLARYGHHHYRVGTAHHNIGIVHTKRGDYPRAISAYKRAVVVRKKTLGLKHADVGASLAQLGVAYLEVGKQKKAITAFREALKIRRHCYGNRHHKVAKILNNIGCALYELDELEVAKVAFEEALQIQRHLLKQIPVDSLVNSHDQLLGIASTQCNIASIKLYHGEFDEALVELEEALLVQQCVLSDDHPVVQRTEESIEWVEKSRKTAESAESSTDLVTRLTGGLQFSRGILTALSPTSSSADETGGCQRSLSVFDFLDQRFMQLHAIACGTAAEPALAPDKSESKNDGEAENNSISEDDNNDHDKNKSIAQQ